MSSVAIRRGIHFGLAAGIAIVLAACSLPAKPVPTYDLIAPRDFGHVRRARGLIEVAVPSALQVLDTEKIEVEPTVGVVTYLSDAQWSDRLPELPAGADDRGIREFLAHQDGRARRRPGQCRRAACHRHPHLRHSGNDAVVELSVKLIGTRSGRINAAKIFTARVPAPSTAGGAAASAINDALMIVLVDLVRWTAGRI